MHQWKNLHTTSDSLSASVRKENMETSARRAIPQVQKVKNIWQDQVIIVSLDG